MMNCPLFIWQTKSAGAMVSLRICSTLPLMSQIARQKRALCIEAVQLYTFSIIMDYHLE